MFEQLGKALGHIPVEGSEALLYQGAKVLLVLLFTYLFLRFLLKRIERNIKQSDASDQWSLKVYKKAAKYLVWTLGIAVAIHMAGIDLSHVFTTGGLVAVALGFALKDIAENYIAGFILRSEEAVKHGDVLYIKGEIRRVKSIGLRSTVIRADDDRDILIPNSMLVQNAIGNYTLNDSSRRITTMVGVSYDSDLKKVREILEKACTQVDDISNRPAEIFLVDFGSSSVNYMVCVWTEIPWRGRRVKSDLNESIWWALKDAGIVIAYPQLDVHMSGGSGQTQGSSSQVT